MLFNINAFATHLVGGEMNYKFIEKGVYEISLTVYRDCFLGVPDFDLPGYILVYEGNGNFLGYYSILGNPKIKLPVEINDDCFVVPPSVCVEKKEYIFVGEGLDSNSTGYYLSYQRCCRNESIMNAYADETDFAGDAGMNLYAYIPPIGELINSNPVFKSFPPIAICVNKRIDFDHSATDIDGDSLSYKLCTPADGLNPTYPTFTGFNYEKLPFRSIRWRNPYTLDNLLGGDDPLTIDSVTGRLTGTPVKVGQFVVGVCVDEYRNGKKIGETRRDFQYNVAPCEKFSTSSFFVMDTICNSLDVVFKNESDGAVNYFWDFGDGVASTEVNPVHTFPDFGTYKISLIAASALGCADTMSKSLSLVVDNLDYDKKNISVCKGDSAWLQLDINEGSIKEVYWMINPSVYTADAQIHFLPEKEGWIYFDVYSTKGCVYNDSVFVELFDKPLVDIRANPDQIFYPQVVNLSTIEDKNYTYE
ncbi:MAG: PKD domain-containing protein [Chitinophagales bacterium]|nr:PKD domain-containing protein [Chitinophagales bacterium]